MESLSEVLETTDLLNLGKSGTVSKQDVLRWSIPDSCLLPNPTETRSDFFRFGPSPNFRFCLIAVFKPSPCSYFKVGLCRMLIDGARASKDEAPIKVSFSLLDTRDRCHHTCERVLDDCNIVQVPFDKSCHTTHHQMFLKQGHIRIHCALDVEEILKEEAKSGWRRPDEDNLDGETLRNDLAKDLRVLLDNGLHSDVTLSIKGNDIRAHKSILTARSTVFAAMFEHDTTEKRENRVVIEDLTSEAMCHLLRFLYTGETDELMSEELLSLFVAADKYNLPKLKQKCSRSLGSQITTEMALTVLVIATLHREESLQKAAVQVVLENAIQVMKTEEWLEFLREYPEIANTIIIKLAMQSINNPFNDSTVI